MLLKYRQGQQIHERAYHQRPDMRLRADQQRPEMRLGAYQQRPEMRLQADQQRPEMRPQADRQRPEMRLRADQQKPEMNPRLRADYFRSSITDKARQGLRNNCLKRKGGLRIVFITASADVLSSISDSQLYHLHLFPIN